MSIQQTSGNIDDKITDKDVASYLREHPDFFESNTPLLRDINIPHLSGAAVSLVERQVGVLRKDNKKLIKKLEELVKNARVNEKLAKQVFYLTLALMSAKDLAQVFTLLQESLRRDFNVDATALKLIITPKEEKFAERGEFVKHASELMQLFDKQLKEGRPICGRFKQEQLEYLFNDKADNVKSVAIIPLGEAASYGILAIGSRNEQRFYAGMGTMYLTQMSSLISKSLQPYIDG